MKNKKLAKKFEDIEVGQQCVVNNLDDTTVYTVSEKLHRIVKLTYTQGNGKLVGGGEVPWDILMIPNAKQLANQ